MQKINKNCKTIKNYCNVRIFYLFGVSQYLVNRFVWNMRHHFNLLKVYIRAIYAQFSARLVKHKAFFKFLKRSIALFATNAICTIANMYTTFKFWTHINIIIFAT